MNRHSFLFAVFIPMAAGVAHADCPPISPSPFWSNTFDFPDDPFQVWEPASGNPDWVKFTIMLCDPTVVYFQDSNVYTFHYDFVSEQLDPYLGISHADFEQIALHEANQELVLGAVLMPSPTWDAAPEPAEYGIQFIRQDPYPPEHVVALFNTVVGAINADPGVQPFYFPTYEQSASAQQHSDYLASQGVMISSPARWAEGNTSYSDGWALGEVKFFEGDEIESAYLSGALLPEDILLTDGVPAEIPFVAGIITLAPTTPNSHAAILAQTYGVPFVHLALAEDVDRAVELLGHRIALRVYTDWGLTELRMIDVEGVLDEGTIAEILALKDPPPLNISPMQPYGAYSANTGDMVLSDIQYFGGKAANYGFLRRAIPDNSPVACALSFDVWNAFTGQTMPGGNTLREDINAILSAHTWPPNMNQLADDLVDIRDLIKDDDETSFAQEVQNAIIATLQDPQYGFDPYKKIRFRSSTNMEDSEQFTGAGLYDSYSGCLADELDGDAAWYVSSWPCDAATGKDDVYAWLLSSLGDVQDSYASANGDIGNPGTFVSEACPTGACCIDGACTETTHSECVGAHGSAYQGNGTTCATITCPQPGDGQMRITEYMYSGSGGEFIEFSNVGTEPIDMTGWSYDDESGIPGTADLSAFGVVDPGESVILTEDSAATFASTWDCSDVTIIGGLTANIGRNDEINLYDALDALADQLTYGDEDFPGSIRTKDASGWPCDVAVGDNNIYGWSLSSVGDIQASYASTTGDVGSPGSFVIDPCPTGACCIEGACTETTQGDCIGVYDGLYQGDGTTCDTITCPEPVTGQMRITEYMSKGSGGEFIEFTNLGAEPVDMTGWSYDDESGIPGTLDLGGFGIVAPGESVILAEDPAATFESDWSLADVTIVGDLTVNLGGSDVIHLYDASDTLVDRLSYQEDEGPSQCDPGEAEERGVFRAIRKVFASFYNDNAFLERLRYGVNEDDVGMAVLVHHSFPDEIEMANGVATFDRGGAYSTQALLVTQLGAVSVANPEGGAIPEEVNVHLYPTSMFAEILRYSSLVLLGDTVLTYDDDYFEFATMMGDVADDYAAAIGESEFLLDFEYKKVAPGGAVLPAGGLVIKQVRKVPQPDTTPSITPFLINEPVEYGIFQGEFSEALANHHLKSRWSLSTQNLWLSAENLETCFYTDVSLEYTEGCWTRVFGAPLPEFPGAWHAVDEPLQSVSDGWVFSDLYQPRHYELRTSNIRTLVSAAESPLLTLSDLGSLEVLVEYEDPVPAWDGGGSPRLITESVTICPELEEGPGDTLQERVLADPSSPIVITTRFYWPGVRMGTVIKTFPLARWDETIIEGLTTEPIVLHGWYSQTYSPSHHNFWESFIFQPRLEPGISSAILDELDAMGVQRIHALKQPAPLAPIITLVDDHDCELESCAGNSDCGYPDFGRYCAKPDGQCDDLGTCIPIPDCGPPATDPVCGCDRVTYDDACHAGQAGVSVAHAGQCLTGDVDLDGDVDLNDFIGFESCLLGPGGGVGAGCDCFDFDDSGDVDLADFGVLQDAFTG